MSDRFYHYFNQNPNLRITTPSSFPFPYSSPSPSPSPLMNPRTSKQVRNTNRRRNPSKKKQTKQIWVKKESIRNWLELPRDVMLLIFLKLGVIDLLFNAQSVCSYWRDIARSPLLYRRVDMSNPWNHFDFDPSNFAPLIKMAIEAVDRSCGQLVEFSVECFGNDEILRRIVRAKCGLKYLRLAACYNLSDSGLAAFVKKMPTLEEFELCLVSFSPIKTIEAAGRCCPELKSFRLNHVGTKVLRAMINEEEVNDEAMAIAGNLPGVQSLHLFGNLLTNKGLLAILEKCPHLEYLDLRQCFNVDVEGDLLKKCQGIKKLKLPFDSTEDYEFDISINYMDSDEEYESDLSYDDYTNPFNDLHLSDDDFFGVNEDGDGPSLVDLILLSAMMDDEDGDDDDDDE